MENKKLVVDIDGTLCDQRDFNSYLEAIPRKDVIEKVNSHWSNGWEIELFTARGMNTCGGDTKLIEQSLGDITRLWLKNNRVCYDKLTFGKPSAYMYVDDKAMRPEEFLKLDTKLKVDTKHVFTNGCFDLLHVGHISIFKFCKELSNGGKVTVAINSDESIRKLKGYGRPVISQNDRRTMIESVKFVDEVVIFEEADPAVIIDFVNPDIVVKGSSYELNSVISAGRKVVLAPMMNEFSTSTIISKIKREYQ